MSDVRLSPDPSDTGACGFCGVNLAPADNPRASYRRCRIHGQYPNGLRTPGRLQWVLPRAFVCSSLIAVIVARGPMKDVGIDDGDDPPNSLSRGLHL